MNPTIPLPLLADCLIGDGSNCKETMTYAWTVLDSAGNVIPEASLTGKTGALVYRDVLIREDFFEHALSLGVRDNFSLTLAAENAFKSKGVWI